MLVLERDEGERIVFAIPPGQSYAEEKISVKLFKIKGGKTVRMGIEAPKHITILRDDANRNTPRRQEEKRAQHASL